MKKVIVSKLWKYNNYYEAKNVHLQNKWSRKVYMNQKWGSCERSFQRLKSTLCLRTLNKSLILLNSTNEKDHYHGIMCNETPIEINESKKTLNIMNKTYNNEIHNGLDLTKIHLNAISKNNVLEETHFNLMESTFFQLCIKSNH